MDIADICHQRLFSQQISEATFRKSEELVFHMGAMQAQDYAGAIWGIALRLSDATNEDIEQAIRDRKIVRTWPMRGTLHFVAAKDVRWMLQLLTPRVIAGTASRQKNLELNSEIFTKSFRVFEKVLAGKQLERGELLQKLEESGISAIHQRGYHLLWRAAQEGVICLGPMSGKQQTFVLLGEWIPEQKSTILSREESLAEITKRYFTSHGPATLQDFVWWSGLKMSEAKEGVQMVSSELVSEKIEDKEYWMARNFEKAKNLSVSYLLPGFDEYMLGYRDRSAALNPKYAQKICPGANGMFLATVVIDGQVRGTWKRTLRKDKVLITPTPFTSFSPKERKSLESAAQKYGKFLGKTAEIN